MHHSSKAQIIHSLYAFFAIVTKIYHWPEKKEMLLKGMQVIAFTLILSYLRPRFGPRSYSTAAPGGWVPYFARLSSHWCSTSCVVWVPWCPWGPKAELIKKLWVQNGVSGIRKRDDSPYSSDMVTWFEIVSSLHQITRWFATEIGQNLQVYPYHIMYYI